MPRIPRPPRHAGDVDRASILNDETTARVERFELGYRGVRTIMDAARARGAPLSARDMLALRRLQDFEGTREDVQQLSTLALIAGLEWSALFPGVVDDDGSPIGTP